VGSGSTILTRLKNWFVSDRYHPDADTSDDGFFRVSTSYSGLNGAIHSAYNLVANTVSTIPIHVYHRETRKRVRDAFYDIFVFGNDTNTWVEIAHFLTYQYLQTGNAYAHITAAKRLALLPLASSNVSVVGPGRYRIGTKTVGRDQILHLRRYTTDLSVGQSDMLLCKNARDNAHEFDRFLSKMLRNDNLKQIYLKYEGAKKALTREERTLIQTEWMRDTQSPFPPVVHQVSPEEFGVKSSDVNITEIKSALMTDICNILGIPPGLMGVGDTTAAQAADDRQRFLDYCIHPLMFGEAQHGGALCCVRNRLAVRISDTQRSSVA